MIAHALSARVAAGKPALSCGALAAAASGKPPSNLLTWYLGLIPHWTGAAPNLKCRLLLRTHQWIVDRVLDPDVSLAAAVEDLRPGGALTLILGGLVPADDASHWDHFIQLVVANLRHALLLPVARRNEAWVRWLFLIPYSIRWEAEPAPAAGHHHPRPGRA